MPKLRMEILLNITKLKSEIDNKRGLAELSDENPRVMKDYGVNDQTPTAVFNYAYKVS
jgi:hypothetical protein